MKNGPAHQEQLSYSLRRQYVDDFLERQFSTTQTGTLGLDVGGHKNEKRGKFDPTHLNPIVLNISAQKDLDVSGDAAWLPFEQGTFEWILCSELLEHVNEPSQVLSEAFRVLKVKGKLIITVPFLFRVHADPVDIGRYTQWYWQRHLEAAGFSSVQIEKQGLFWSVAVDMGREFFRNQALTGRVRGKPVLNFLSWITARARTLAIRFDRRPDMQEHDFFGRYVGGFGISASKLGSTR